MTIQEKVGARAEVMHPSNTSNSVTMMTLRWWGPSASLPITGVASAPVRREAVRTQSAVASRTPCWSAIVGISGAPRLETSATMSPMPTRVGTRALPPCSESALGFDKILTFEFLDACSHNWGSEVLQEGAEFLEVPQDCWSPGVPSSTSY